MTDEPTALPDRPDRLPRRRVTTRDGVDLSLIDTGEREKPALVLVHGLSQSALSWHAQFASEALRARYRIVAVDLRGHGRSEGALGAVGDDGRVFGPLPATAYGLPGDRAGTSRLWANDVDAVVDGLGLDAPVLVGWSYGAVVLCDYMASHGGLGAAAEVVLVNGTPGLLPFGSPEIGIERIFHPAVPAAVLPTLDVDPTADPAAPSTADAVLGGLAAFVGRALADTVEGRPPADRDAVLAAVAYNLLLPPAARAAILAREIDHRAFLASLPTADRTRIRVLAAAADAVVHAENAAAAFRGCGLPVDVADGEGHAVFARNPALFDAYLLARR